MFNNLVEIIESFDLKSTSKVDIRKELKQKLKKIHPDKNGGEFKSYEEKEMFEQINSAIEYLDAPFEVALRGEMSSLTKAINDLTIINNRKIDKTKFDELLVKKIDSNIKNYKSTHLFSKITSSIIAGFLSIIWLFPNTISDHKILSKLIDVNSTIFTYAWLYILLFTCIVWFMLYRKERLYNDRNNTLKLETTQNQIFDKFIKYKLEDIRNNDEVIKLYITKENFINFIRGINSKDQSHREFSKPFQPPLELIFGRTQIDLSLAENICETILHRMSSNKLIKRLAQKTTSDLYVMQLNKALVKYYS